MTSTKEEPVYVDAEECMITLTFKEVRLRGTDKFKCVVVADDDDAPDQDVSDSIEASSWELMKKTYPTLKDLVEHMFWSEHWQVCGCGHDERYLILAGCSGHEGIYDYAAGDDIRVLWSDIKDNDIVYPKE